MEVPYALQHEAAELTDTITRNFQLYQNSGQERTERGKLTDPLAQTFEQRMNTALEKYYDLGRAAVGATVSSFVTQ